VKTLAQHLKKKAEGITKDSEHTQTVETDVPELLRLQVPVRGCSVWGDYRRHRCQEFYSSSSFERKKILTTSFTFFICSVFHGWPDAARTVPFFKNFFI
jgi:hypothetical protein